MGSPKNSRFLRQSWERVLVFQEFAEGLSVDQFHNETLNIFLLKRPLGGWGHHRPFKKHIQGKNTKTTNTGAKTTQPPQTTENTEYPTRNSKHPKKTQNPKNKKYEKRKHLFYKQKIPKKKLSQTKNQTPWVLRQKK